MRFAKRLACAESALKKMTGIWHLAGAKSHESAQCLSIDKARTDLTGRFVVQKSA